MPRGDAERIRRYLLQIVAEARREGITELALRAGDIHRALNMSNSYANVCQVLESKRFHAMANVAVVRYVNRPLSGQGVNLEINFQMLPDTTVKQEWRYVISGTAQLWTTASGIGIPLLMFNGGPGCDDYLAPVAEMIDDLCQVIRFEPRGCGRSDWDGNYDVDTLVTDADSVRREYQAERCILAGHSYGANAALAYALKYPSRVMGLIGIAGGNVLNDRSWSEAYHRALEEEGEDLGGHDDWADPAVNPSGNHSWREYIKHPTLFREIADLDVPAFFINGGADIRPDWPTRQLAYLVARGRYNEIPGAAHSIWLTHSTELRYELRKAVEHIVRSNSD